MFIRFRALCQPDLAGILTGLCRAAALLMALAVMGGVSPVRAQGAAMPPPGSPPEGGPRRPPLFFKEEWHQASQGGEQPVTAASVANPALQMQLLVPAGQILITGKPGDENNPLHVWLGLCTGPCGLVFRDPHRVADLSGLARLRWNTRTSGYHQIRPLVRLVDGTWLVGDRADASPRDWIVSEISFADLHWLKLDESRAVTTGTLLERVDLTKVDAVGFVDLMPGSGHGPGGWSDVAAFEVYAKATPR